MAVLGEIVIYVMMVFVLIGAVAAVRDSQSGFGKEFLQGIHAIGYLFIRLFVPERGVSGDPMAGVSAG
ncbi:hypothetical protein GCM10025789_30450 [Tessaracoccus lubricantis]|uniref:Uncharacterized protein n=1 Tax=Tessaracoccus lubricantis TaxID=545543 RepID=A0ABP9FNF3_9ACTN